MWWLMRGEDDVPADDAWLAPAEAARLARYRFPKRRAEYRLRRWVGKQAAAAIAGLDPAPESVASIEVLNRSTGAPYVQVHGVPLDVDISLSDRAGRAVCLIGERFAAGVGIDLEIIEPRSDGFVRDFLTPAEQAFVRHRAAAWELGRDAAATLIWSAKESALKVLGIGLGADTWTVEVRLTEPSGSEGWAPLEVHQTGTGRRFPGWWRRDEAFLLTVAHGAEAPPPGRLP